MKLFGKTLLCLLVGFVLSCSKSSPTISLAGKWTVSLYTVSGCKNSADNFSQPYGCPGTISKWCEVYTFNPNKTCSLELTATSTETDTGTYSIIGNWISINFTKSSEAWQFAVAGNKLTFTLNDQLGNGCVYTMVLNK